MSGVDYRPLADQQAAAMYQQQNPYGQPGQQPQQYAQPGAGYASQPPAYVGQQQQPIAYAPPQGYAQPPQQQQQQQYQPQQYQQQFQPGQYQPQQQYASQPYASPPAYAQPPQQVVYAQPPVAYAAPVVVAAPVAKHGGGGGGKQPKAAKGPAHPHGGLVDAPPRFEKAPHTCRDLVWSILFLAHFIGICALAGIMWSMYKHVLTDNQKGDNSDDNNYNGGGTNADGSSNQNELKFDGKAAGIIGIVVAGSFVMAGTWLEAFKRWSRTIIWVCLIASPIFFFAVAILFFVYLDNLIVGIVFMICAALNALYVYLVRSRIAFSATILSIVVQVLQMYPAVTVTAFAAIFVQVGWIFIWTIAAAGCMHSFKNQEKTTYDAQDGTTTTTNNNGTVGVVWFFLVLSFFWTATVIKNVCHVTTAGVIATWYFLAPDNMPSNPTSASLKRASWSSFGSICLGSLMIAVVKTLRYMVRTAQGRTDHPIAQCIVMCLLGCLERAVEFFNQYAFTQIAIYGKPYCAAAQDTWNLLKSSGISALINDDLTGTALVFAALGSGLVGAAGAAVLARTVLQEPLWGLWALIGGLTSLGITLIALEVVASGVTAFFVCYAEDPAALQNTKPELQAAMNDAIHKHETASGKVIVQSNRRGGGARR